MASINTNADTSIAGEYLTFGLGAELYCVATAQVREILDVLPITPMPRTPRYVKGVIGFRGETVFVIDARVKFGMPERESAPGTSIILVGAGGKSAGLLIDTVKGVIVGKVQIGPPPCFGAGAGNAFVIGLVKFGDPVKLLDIDRMLEDLKLS